MRYRKIVAGEFVSRPNRFIAKVCVDGREETVHVKNTGRCKELLLPGSKVILEDFRDVAGERKTKFDLVSVYKTYPENPEKKPLLVNMDSQAPNKIVQEWLESGAFEKRSGSKITYIKSEHVYGDSRIDFYFEQSVAAGGSGRSCGTGEVNEIQKCLMEVKGCTLEIDGTGFFPDAPTIRGVKHLHELARATAEGYKCFLCFVIQMEGVREVKPNVKTHPEFAVALEEAKAAGVEVIFLPCIVKEAEVVVGE